MSGESVSVSWNAGLSELHLLLFFSEIGIVIGRGAIYRAKAGCYRPLVIEHSLQPSVGLSLCVSECLSVCLSVRCIVAKRLIEYGLSLIHISEPTRPY